MINLPASIFFQKLHQTSILRALYTSLRLVKVNHLIISINLNATQVTDQEQRNKVSHTSTFTQNAEELIIKDVWFRKDAIDVAYEFDGVVSSVIEAMPEIKGSGRVKNLSHAMSTDAELKEKVQTLLNTASNANYETLLSQTKDILVKWTHTGNIAENKTRGEQQILNHTYSNATPRGWRYRIYAYARDVAILENFAGKEFSMYSGGELTFDVLGTELASTMKNRLNYLQNTTLINLLSQDIYGNEVDYFNETNKSPNKKLYLDKVIYLQYNEQVFSINELNKYIYTPMQSMEGKVA